MYLILSLLSCAALLAVIFIRKLIAKRFRNPVKILLLSVSIITAILHFRSLPRDEIGERYDEVAIHGFLSHLPPKDKVPARLILHGPISKQYLANKLCLALDRPIQPLESVQEYAAKPDADKEALVIFFDGLPRITPAQDLPKKWLYAVFAGEAYQAESYFALPGFLGIQTRCENVKVEKILLVDPLEGTTAALYSRYFRFWKGGEFEAFQKKCRIPPPRISEEEESP